MKNKDILFNNEGINRLDYLFKITDSELHPMYLCSLIDFLGRSMYQLPTKKNEDILLMRIKEISGLNISTETIIRAQRILTISRKRRMRETGIFLIQSHPKNNR